MEAYLHRICNNYHYPFQDFVLNRIQPAPFVLTTVCILNII